ncbi:MAG: hypothetical protein HOW73_48035 [Polyangiaceae bacterium]|nr:hypothetical protein [Polyangiaceae bacterium]
MAEVATGSATERGSTLRSIDRFIADNHRWVTLAVFAIALVPRLYVAMAWAREPVWDGHYYHFGAGRIAEGVGYGDDRSGVFRPWCHYPVGYSGFLGLFYAVFGVKPTVATAVQALVGAATVATVHQLALTFLSHRRALIAALLCAACPNLILYSGLVMTEPLAGLGLLLAPLAFAKLSKKSNGTFDRRSLFASVVAGIIFGLTTLVRPQTLLCAPAVALLGPKRGGWKGRLAVAVMTTAMCFAVVLPWTVRNCKQMDSCAFVSTNAGWNLAIGSHPNATGRYIGLTSKDGCGDVVGQVDQDRCFAHKGIQWIKDDPVRWISLAPVKLSFTFDHQSFAVGYLAQADPAAWPEERRAFYRRLMSMSQYVLILLAALGALVLPRERKGDALLTFALALAPVLFMDGLFQQPERIWPLALAIPIFAVIPPLSRSSGGKVEYLAWSVATLVIVHIAFFGEDRYQVVVTPALALLAACAFRPRVTDAEGEVARPKDAKETV